MKQEELWVENQMTLTCEFVLCRLFSSADGAYVCVRALACVYQAIAILTMLTAVAATYKTYMVLMFLRAVCKHNI